MNALKQWIEDGWHDEVQVMNYLQDNGIVSDNAVYALDVCREDVERALTILRK